jgi:tetratricopeptide (TPR) repeat protein
MIITQHLFAATLLAMAMMSCSTHNKKVADANDYAQYVRVVADNNTDQLIEQISFWQKRYQRNPADQTSLIKLAGFHALRFKSTGEIQDIHLSDSLYREASRKSSFNRSFIMRALAANAISRHEFWNARNLINVALTAGENKSLSLLMLADVQLELGNGDTARTILERFQNKSSFAWLIRASKLMDHEGHLDSAILLMEKALRPVESNDELFCWTKSNLGDMYGHAGRIEDSYAAYLDALRRKPDYDYALKGIAWIAFSHDRDTQESMRILNTLQNLKTSPDYYLMLSEINGFSGNQRAKEDYVNAFMKTVASPLFGNMYNRHLALLYADEKNNLNAAVKIARKEINVRPTPESYDLLAWTLFRSGETDHAITILKDFVEDRTSEPEALYHMGMIYQSADLDKSRSYLLRARQSAFELGPVKTRNIEVILNQF